ncbi:hypothetical protein SAMN04487969_15114 [Paenibacillus algorifonticola]|uniref:Uncharacterized protein n=1 Tax=Paenibacillus algorifonticola TaxID=684063 RepID=A0A1I2J235_9BACL|nr:hypothetical protein [Paenibacillus algorifonticola]SFF48509.1 hypothetical protein SAMN04487969_15114 [Paenibacillus algorifonticola]
MSSVTSDISRYYNVVVTEDKIEKLAEQLRNESSVEAAFIKTDAEPAVSLTEKEQPPSTTPDFAGRQGYLRPAPEGVDCPLAWAHLGGRGGGVNIIDIEGGAAFFHEDLLQNQDGLAGALQVI